MTAIAAFIADAVADNWTRELSELIAAEFDGAERLIVVEAMAKDESKQRYWVGVAVRHWLSRNRQNAEFVERYGGRDG